MAKFQLAILQVVNLIFHLEALLIRCWRLFYFSCPLIFFSFLQFFVPFSMPLGMFQNPLHLINSHIDCIHATHELSFFHYILWFFFITSCPCLMFPVPSHMPLRIFTMVVVSSCFSSSLLLLPLEVVAQFVISPLHQCCSKV